MWGFKNAALSMWNKTKNILVDNRTPVEKLIDEIEASQDEIIPTNKLSELSMMTYDFENF